MGRTSRTANSVKSSPTASTTRCVKISRGSRRSVPIGVFVITGASACAVNTRRRPDDVAALLVSPRRREANFQHPTDDGKAEVASTSTTATSSLAYFWLFVFGLSFRTDIFFLLPVKQQQQQHLMCQHVEYEEYSLCKHASGTTIVVLIKKKNFVYIS